jgi:hypothetical protein
MGGNGIFEGDEAYIPNMPLQNILWQALGLPSGLSCPDVGGLSSYLCGGVNPIMDATSLNAMPCLAGYGPLQAGQSRCGGFSAWGPTDLNALMTMGTFGANSAGRCYGSGSLFDQGIRTFSVLRLADTWNEWLWGGASKAAFIGGGQAGATAAGGAESATAATFGAIGKGLARAANAGVIYATAADALCRFGPG